MVDRFVGAQPRHLAALSAVRAEGSIKAAAGRLGYVQSAVSQQLGQLEKIAGAPLLERTPGQARFDLTPEGALLAAHAEAILHQLDAAAADVEAVVRPRAELRVGGARHGVDRLVVDALRRLGGPRAGLQVALDGSADECEGVSSGILDAAFGELPLPAGPFAWSELLADPHVLVVQAGSLLARRRTPLTPRDLAAVPLLLPNGTTASLVERRLRAEGLEAQVVLRCDGPATAQRLAAAGVGAAPMPRLAVDTSDTSVELLDLADWMPARRLALFWHAGRRAVPGLRALRRALEAVAAPAPEPAPAPPVAAPPAAAVRDRDELQVA
jgi:DNA-binding transcriptional LysR family regulator